MLQFHFLERKRECEMHQAVLGRGLATPFLQLLLLLNPGVSLWWGGFETSLPLQSTTVPGRDRAAPPAPMGQGGKASVLSSPTALPMTARDLGTSSTGEAGKTLWKEIV